MPFFEVPTAVEAAARMIQERDALIAAQEERIAILEKYIREGGAALTCTGREVYGPQCGGCDGCITAQVIHSVRTRHE